MDFPNVETFKISEMKRNPQEVYFHIRIVGEGNELHHEFKIETTENSWRDSR